MTHRGCIGPGNSANSIVNSLSERMKELRCLNELAMILQEIEDPEKLLTEAVLLLPPAWQYPEIARARITFEQQQYLAGPFEKTEWVQSSELQLGGKVFGAVEICYMERRPQQQEGPFLAEERKLLDSFAYLLAAGIQNRRSLIDLGKSTDLLSAMQTRLELALRFGNVGLWDWKIIEDDLYLSPEWKAQIGYREDELENNYETWESRLHPDDREPTLRRLQACLEGKNQAYNVEFRLRHKDGSYRWILAEGDLLRDASERPARIMGCHIDVTAQKAQMREAELRASLANIFHTTPDDEMYGDVLEVVLSALESKFGLFGYIEENGDLVIPSMTRGVWSKCQVADKKIVFPRETWGDSIWPRAIRQKETLYSNSPSFLIPKGHISIDRNIAAPVIHQGRVIGLLHVANKQTDYTPDDIKLLETICGIVAPVLSARLERDRQDKARQHVTDQLRESANKMSIIVEHIGVGVALIDKKMQIIEANSRFIEYFPDVDISERPVCYEVCNDSPREEPCPDCPTRATLNDGLTNETIMSRASAGKTKQFRIMAAPVRDEEGVVVGAIELIEDVTEQIQVRESLQQTQRLESLGTLAGGIAHDFNNLLYIMQVNADLVKEQTPKDSESYNCLDQLAIAGNRAKELVKQILVFSRGEAQCIRSVEIQTEVQETLVLLRQALPSSIEIRQELDPDCCAVIADPTEIHQVILNLCTNASHAMGNHGGVLTLRLNEMDIDSSGAAAHEGLMPGKYACLSVADTGHGMDERTRSRAMDPFFTTKAVGEGVGLGLASVYGIVERLGGRVTIESAPELGTTVYIYLPLSISDKMVIDSDERGPNEVKSGGGEHVLFVDDEKAITRLGILSLQAGGYTVSGFSDSLAALEAFRSAPDEFDVIVTDQTMPKLTGLGLAEEIHRIRPGVPIIICTGGGDVIDRDQMENLGIRDSLQKPIPLRTLWEAIRQVVDYPTMKVK